jgi:hypothetical protein
MSITQNVKGNRKIVVASYTTEAVFKIPDGLDLEDKTVVQDWRTKYGKLYITYVNSEELLEIDSEWDTEIDYKYSSDEVIMDADEFHIDYEQDDEPSEPKDSEPKDSETKDSETKDSEPKDSEAKCDSDSDNESDDGWNKEYRITDIDFDKADYDVLEEFGIEDWDEFNKSLIKETCSKTWIANCKEKLCDKISDETGWLINSFSCERVCAINHKDKEDKYEVRVLRTICTADDDSDNTEDEGLQIVSSKTFSDIEEARLYFNENVKSYKLLQEDHDYHVEFDDITHEFDPEMIEMWSGKDEELKAWCEALPVVDCRNCGKSVPNGTLEIRIWCETCQIKADGLV